MIQIVTLLCIALYGVLISYLLGMKHQLSVTYGWTDDKAGGLFSLFMVTGGVVVIVLSSLIDVIGHKVLVLGGFAMVALLMVLLGFSKKYTLVAIAYALMSVGGMALISTGNTLSPLVLFGGQNAPAAVNLSNVFYGVGAFAASLSLGFIIAKVGFKNTNLIFAILFLLPLLFVAGSQFPQGESDFSFAKASGLFSGTAFILALTTNFFAAGAENGVGAWINTRLVRLGMSDKLANGFLSLFFVSIVLSRLLSVVFVTPANTGMVILINALLALLFIAVSIVSRNKWVVGVAMFLAGMTLGPNVPNVFGYLFTNTPLDLHGTAFGFCFAAGLAGASLSPWLIGLVSRRSNLAKGFWVNLAFAALLALCALAIHFGFGN